MFTRLHRKRFVAWWTLARFAKLAPELLDDLAGNLALPLVQRDVTIGRYIVARNGLGLRDGDRRRHQRRCARGDTTRNCAATS
jgi:hypothetical protein